MKKIYLHLLLGFLFLSSQAQWYEYTETSFVNNFTGTEHNKINAGGDTVFYWDAINDWLSETFTQSGGELYVDDGAHHTAKLELYFDSINIDISSAPYLIVEAKADTIIEKEYAILYDETGANTGFNYYLGTITTNYQRYVVDFQGMPIDSTNISKIRFWQGDTEITWDNNNIYFRYLALGDTSGGTVTELTPVSKNVEDKLVCYPNPVQNQLHVSGVEGINEAAITDLTGKVLMIINAADVADGINVAGLASGMYIISIETANGKFDEIFIKE